MTAVTVGLIGNPNSGKTTLFNALTGARQQVGNWPGVTVEKNSGFFNLQQKTIHVVDLPGIYALQDASSMDERITLDYCLSGNADLFINVIDASNLERNFYLTTQLLEMQLPLIVVLNMIDRAEHQGLSIDEESLAERLNCPVIAIEAHKAKGLVRLKQAILAYTLDEAKRIAYPSVTSFYPAALQQGIEHIAAALNARPVEDLANMAFSTKATSSAYWQGLRLLEGDEVLSLPLSTDLRLMVQKQHELIKVSCGEDADILLADARYRFVGKVLADCEIKKAASLRANWTERIDRVVLNRYLSLPIFFMIMYLLFFFAITVGGAFQDFFDIASDTLFVQGIAYGLAQIGMPDWLIALLAAGAGRGINTTLTFIPVIGAMFFFLAILEDSGYMARAAFVIDRIMRALSLPGKAFVPLLIGFGCNVPAVMAARTLESKRDRILTVMMSPFMSCGARLAIYAIFTTAFFSYGGQNIIFALYMVGIAMAMLTGWLLRKTVLTGAPSPLLMELPPYHLPQLKAVLKQAGYRLHGFIWRAGKLIIPICMLLGMLNMLHIDGSQHQEGDGVNSLLAELGHFFTPVFHPMGIQADNWPATVGLITGILAKEVVIGTLDSLYSQLGQVAEMVSTTSFSVVAGLKQALLSIPHNIAELGQSFIHPFAVHQATTPIFNQAAYGVMYRQFDGKQGAIAYLLFVLLYMPCVSTTAVMAREVGKRWALFSVIWTTAIAYSVAVVFYQFATFALHPLASTAWVVGILLTMVLAAISMRLKPTWV